MTEQEKQAAEKLRNSSEFIRAAESFARYAHKEWVQGCDGQRALILGCVDRTIPDGVGAIGVAVGDSDLIAAALLQLRQDETLGKIFHKVRMVSDTHEDINEELRNIRRSLKISWCLVGVLAGWTLCVIAFRICGIANWITTVSCLLMNVVIGHMLFRDIFALLRRAKRLVMARARDHEKRLEMMEQQLNTFMDSLKARLRPDDDDEEY